MRKKVVLGSFALFAVTLFSLLAGTRQPATDLQLGLEAVKSRFTLVEPVILRISLNNLGVDGVPAIIDPTFTPTSGGARPTSILLFEVRDQEGRIVAPQELPPGLEAGLRPSELLILSPGYFLGQEISLTPPSPWQYHLRPGQYKIRAHLTLATRSFFDKRPQLFRQLVDSTGKPQDVLQVMLPESTLVSNAVEVGILPRR